MISGNRASSNSVPITTISDALTLSYPKDVLPEHDGKRSAYRYDMYLDVWPMRHDRKVMVYFKVGDPMYI